MIMLQDSGVPQVGRRITEMISQGNFTGKPVLDGLKTILEMKAGPGNRGSEILGIHAISTLTKIYREI
jgi:hypothetical protein